MKRFRAGSRTESLGFKTESLGSLAIGSGSLDSELGTLTESPSPYKFDGLIDALRVAIFARFTSATTFTPLDFRFLSLSL